MTMTQTPTLVLAHGAGAGRAHPWMRHVADGLEHRGVRVVTFDFLFGIPDDMRDLIDELPSATLHLVDRGDHSLIQRRGTPVGDRWLDLVADWIKLLPFQTF